MSELGFPGWAFVALGGIIILGIFIAYGMMRNKGRTPRERAVTEAATRDLYDKEGRGTSN